MQKWKLRGRVNLLVLALAIFFAGGTGTAFAVTSSSTNYKASEMQIGSGSSLESCSGEFCARASIGDLTADAGSSNGSTASFGAIESSDPLLEVIVDMGESDLGLLSTEKTATKTTTVRIRNYRSNGYILQIVGDPPTYKDYKLKTPNTPTVSKKGVEQFAINLAANSSPQIGTGPMQIPSSEMSFGEVEPNYAIPDMFMYRSGDVVARSHRESGRTDYTISMIVNISNATPAGKFSTDYAAVVTPVY